MQNAVWSPYGLYALAIREQERKIYHDQSVCILTLNSIHLVLQERSLTLYGLHCISNEGTKGSVNQFSFITCQPEVQQA